ncbi:MAG: (2Fe-2S)-binding protein [Salinigranum sp.]
MEIDLTINGEDTTVTVDGETDLATVLRDEGYKGVKCGCDGGDCGASSVLIDGSAQMACGTTAAEADGSSVETIEGLGSQDSLHPLQQAFVDHFAVQCGFCIPGMIMQAKDLLADNPDPSEAEVRDAIDDVICRCTGYQKPVEAILDAADRMREEGTIAADGGTRTDENHV